MRTLIIGAGPAGLYLGILLKKLNPSHEVTILERDGPNDLFGWGIVFSDQTFSYLKENDSPSYSDIINNCEVWDNVDIVHKDQKITIRGNNFSGIGRLTFLNILQKRCLDLGVNIAFHHNVLDLNEVGSFDLLV